jgi:hypothetical protein
LEVAADAARERDGGEARGDERDDGRDGQATVPTAAPFDAARERCGELVAE